VHDNEIVTSVELVERLVAQQFPQWADLPVLALPIGGTDHSLYRLGDDLVARLPGNGPCRPRSGPVPRSGSTATSSGNLLPAIVAESQAKIAAVLAENRD